MKKYLIFVLIFILCLSFVFGFNRDTQEEYIGDLTESQVQEWTAWPFRSYLTQSTPMHWSDDNIINGPHSVYTDEGIYIPGSHNDCGIQYYSWYSPFKDWSKYDKLVWCKKVVIDSGGYNHNGGLMVNVRGGRSVGIPYGSIVSEDNEWICKDVMLREDLGLTDEELTHINFVKEQNVCNDFQGYLYVDVSLERKAQCTTNQLKQRDGVFEQMNHFYELYEKYKERALEWDDKCDLMGEYP